MSDELDTSHCCDPGIEEPRVENPPGLRELVYRVGTHGAILRRMLEQLSRESIQNPDTTLRFPLNRLSTRSNDDPSIAMLDGWSTVADVLTFYQERIANEGFLRTATERRSILELAALIGYKLNPGVAASAFCAFSVDTAQGAPTSAVVPKGTRIQSVPGQNELPQTFETSEDVTARVEWNELRPRLQRPQELGVSGGKLFLLALSTGFGAGAVQLNVADVEPLDATAPLPSSGTIDAIEVNVIYLAGTNSGVKAGDVMLFVGRKLSSTNAKTLALFVRSATDENDLNRTRIEFESPLPVTNFTYRPLTYAVATATIQQAALDAHTVDTTIINQSWSDTDLNAFLNVQGWSTNSLLSYAYFAFAQPRPQPKLSPADPGLFVLRARTGFFGHNAPSWVLVTKDLVDTVKPADWDTPPGLTIWQNSDHNSAFYTDADCFLERVVPGITANSWAVFELQKGLTVFRVKSAIESSLSAFGLSGKSSGLNLANDSTGDELDLASEKEDKFRVKKTTAHVASERSTLAQLPIEDLIGRGSGEETELTLDRMVLNISQGQRIALTGERADLRGATISEVVTVREVEHSGGFTTLYFESPGLQFSYIRKTVKLNANVAVATHGETVAEVLGSGSSSVKHQTFTLKRPPLTFTASSGASGSQSSLEVRVNGVLWSEASGLIDQAPASETYILQITDDGKTNVVFGDGEHGARLPSGVENVGAKYRTGIGSTGMVPAGKLTLLMTKPLGIGGVTNPLPASGAADPEGRDSARVNAPVAIMAMGRIVSLFDAEDFSRAFAGIGKAKSTSLWRNGLEFVHLTVAASTAVPGIDGAATTLPDFRVDLNSPLGQNLAAAIDRSKELSMNIRIDTYVPVYFNVSSKVLIDERYLWVDVESRVRAAIIEAFSFQNRDFAEGVTSASVISVIQSVEGVVFVDLDELRRFDQPTPALPENGVLIAGGVVWPDAASEPTSLAQLLLINPLGITLSQLTREAAQ